MKKKIKELAINEKDTGSSEIQVGLLTEKTQEKYEQMDILQFQDLEDDKVIDWDEMSKPLEYSSKTA